MSHQFDRVLLHNDEGVPIAAIWATFGSGEIITRNEEVYKKAKSIRFGTREFQVNSFKTDGKKNQYLIFDVEEI
jgi:hypothetical protein